MFKKITAAFILAAFITSACACNNAQTVTTAEAVTTTASQAETTEKTTEGTSAANTEAVTESNITAQETTETTTAAETTIAETAEAVTTTAQTTVVTTTVEQTSAETTVSAATTEAVATTSEAVAKADGDRFQIVVPEVKEEEELSEEEEQAIAEKMESQYEEQREKYLRLYERLSEEKDIPIISVITLDKEEVLSKEKYVTSMVDVFNCDEEFVLSAAAGIRVRGNSTAEGAEKPYRIKFEKKKNLLGLHEGKEYKSWVLLKSQWNLAMDYMGFSLADAILEDEYYSSDCTYVNVYINGKFKGLYLLCEQNQIGKDRVDIYEPEKNETGTDIGYFVEIDHYADEGDEPYFTVDYLGAELTDVSGRTETFVSAEYTIKNDTYSDEQREFIAKYINGAFEILYEAAENNKPMKFDENYNVVSADGEFESAEEAVRAVIDVNSLAYLLIHDELIHDYDVGEGSFYMAVDFSEDSHMKKLTFTAPWDFNWAYNENPSRRFFACTFQPIIGESDRSNPWYIAAMKADWFSDIVKEKWCSLYSSGVLTDVTAEVKTGVEALRNDLGDETWKIDSANQIVDFVNKRIEWLNKQWG